MARSAAEYQAAIQKEIDAFNVGVAKQLRAHQDFLQYAQLGDWGHAEHCRLEASAWYEAQLDAFTRACRTMEEGRRNA